MKSVTIRPSRVGVASCVGFALSVLIATGVWVPGSVAPAAWASAFPGANGKLIYSERPSGSSTVNLYEANADGTNPTQITSPSSGVQDVEPRFSSDGTKIVWLRETSVNPSGNQIWTANTDGTSANQLSITGLPSGDTVILPTFSADGTEIAFEDDHAGVPSGIWEVPVAGGAATQLTSGNDSQPTFSPDGTKLAFFRAFTLEVANADGTNPQAVFTAAYGDFPEFSPDGQSIVFEMRTQSTGNTDVYAVSAAPNSTPTNLTSAASENDTSPAYSPEGTQIAFLSSAGGIEIMDASGGGATSVIDPAGAAIKAVDWQPVPGGPVTTTTSAKSSKNPADPGDQVTYTATVSPAPDGGTVEFTDGGTPISGCDQVAVDPAAGTAMCPQTYGSGGEHTIRAAYSGDTGYAGSTSSALAEVVKIATQTSLTPSPDPAQTGQAMAYTATVTPAPDGGTVSFVDTNGVVPPGCYAVPVNPSTGAASCPQTYDRAGSYTVQAYYQGDPNYAPSMSSEVTETVISPYPPPSIIGLYRGTVYGSAGPITQPVEAEFTQDDPNGTCAMRIYPHPSLAPHGGNPFPCFKGASGVTVNQGTLAYDYDFQGLAPTTAYQVEFAISNSAGTASKVIKFTTGAAVTAGAAGAVGVTANVSSSALGGTANANISVAGHGLFSVAHAAARRLRYVVIGEVTRQHLKVGKLRLRIKPTNRAFVTAIRTKHTRRVSARLNLTIRNRHGKIVTKSTQTVTLRF